MGLLLLVYCLIICKKRTKLKKLRGLAMLITEDDLKGFVVRNNAVTYHNVVNHKGYLILNLYYAIYSIITLFLSYINCYYYFYY